MHAQPDDENAIGPDLSALERRLAAWRPATGALDRDRMLYNAGRAAAAAGARTWRLASAALLLATTGLGGLLFQQRSLLARERAERIELAARLAAPATAPAALAPPVESAAPGPPAPGSYLALTARLAEGVDFGSPPEGGGDREPRMPSPPSWEPATRPVPLRPIDLQRVLDL